MAWVEPKTNWVTADYFEIMPDWQRITGNIEELALRARGVFGRVELLKMAQVGQGSLPFAEVLQAVEDNVETLGKKLPLIRDIAPKRELVPNGSVWNFDDLNRLERSIIELNEIIEAGKANRPVLAFVLGGDNFA